MKKIAFLDRDGVINNDTGHYYIYKPEDFVLNEELILSLRYLQEQGYAIVIITNQGGVARGTYSKADVQLVHDKFLQIAQAEGIDILAIYYCPHHNNVERCLCRKPLPLMIQKAMARFNADASTSFMIGDNVKDVHAAEAAGIKGYLIDKNTSILPLVKAIAIK